VVVRGIRYARVRWLLAVLHSFVPNYGLVDHPADDPRARGDGAAHGEADALDGAHAAAPAEDQGDPGKYADDRQKQSEAMMSLYRQEKVNPLGGCLPMFLQLPVFIGLFYALRSSIQLRQAPFVGWIDDLSAPDLLFTMPGFDSPVRLLPLLMGASMFVQQKITPVQTDPGAGAHDADHDAGMMTVSLLVSVGLGALLDDE
jgi:YidC/Oxa1 family membrane protein insertase